MKAEHVSCRFPAALKEELREHVESEGYASDSAYILEAVKEKMRRGDLEKNMLQQFQATVSHLGRRIDSLDQAQRMSFSAHVGLVRLFLLYFPEPGDPVLRMTKATEGERYQQFIKDVTRIFHSPVAPHEIARVSGD